MRVLTWLLRAFLFFVLFAFALNNLHEVRLKWFFGYEWRAPMVIVVLAAFAGGCAIGLLGHLPSTWRQLKRGGQRQAADPSDSASQTAGSAGSGSGTATSLTSTHAARSSPGPDTLLEPPRDGL